MLKDLVTSKWLWITIICCMAVFTLPWFVIHYFLVLPSPINAILLLTIAIAWGVVAGLNDWTLNKKQEKLVPYRKQDHGSKLIYTDIYKIMVKKKRDQKRT